MRKMALLAAVALLIAGTPAVPVQAASAGMETGSIVLQAEGTEAQVRAFVERMYTVALGRGFDPHGMEDWTSQLLSHENDGAGIARGFLLSEEFTGKNLSNEDYVDTLYRTFFDREADAEGRQNWLNALAGGQSRTFVLAGFVNSEEFDNLCVSFGIARGTLFENGEAANPGIRLFVERMYTKALNRQGEKEGIDNWTNSIVWGINTSEQVAKHFFLSEEFQNRSLSNEDYVETLYQTFLDRDSDVLGKADWLSRLANGASREEVLEGFTMAPEFYEILVKFGLTEETGQEPTPTAAPDATPAPTEEATIEPTTEPTAQPDTADHSDVVTTGTVVGSTDCSTPFWTEFSEPVTVPNGESVVINFINYSDQLAYWHNAFVILQNVKAAHSPLDNADYVEYAVLRMDNWGWGVGYDGIATAKCDWNWSTFLTDIDYASVEMTITNNGSTADVVMVCTTTKGVNYTQSYTGIAVTGDLYYCFTVENAFIDIQSSGETPSSTMKPATTAEPTDSSFIPWEQAGLEDYAMDWKDANLEAAMREVTGITDRDIMLSDVWEITYLYLDFYVLPDDGIVTDISSLAVLTNLTDLYLGEKSIKDISCLANLTNLTSLELGGNCYYPYDEFLDISCLAGLTKLTYLELGWNNIKDISCLSGLTNLTRLKLDYTTISDISVLSNLTNLTYLDLFGNEISDISSLKDLTNLKTLYLSDNNISDINSLAGLVNLTRLDLEDNRINDVSSLAGLTNLETLYLSGNNITDFSPLDNLTNCKIYK